MKITKLILHGYKRFLLNGVKHFEYTPDSPFQLIVGTNGSGKTSLLEELSMLPAESDDYSPDGYKEIHATFNNKSYILRNTFPVKAGKHDFIVDGVYLNEQGTQSAQKDLVYEHFGYNNEIHELLMGTTTFTALSPSNRRALFVKLSQSDMTFAVSIYQKLKSKLRDLQGTIKQLNDIISSEQLKLLPENEIKHHKHQLTHLTAQLKQVYQVMGSFKSHEKVGVEQLDKLWVNLERRFFQIDEAVRDTLGQASLAQTERAVVVLEAKLDELERRYQESLKEASELEKSLQKVSFDASFDIDYYRDKQQKLGDVIGRDLSDEDKETIEKYRQEDLTHIVQCFRQFSRDRDIQSFFLNFPENPNQEKYNSILFNQKQSRETEVSYRLNHLKMQNERITYALEEMAQKPSQECPSCHYNWIPGFSEDKKKKGEKKFQENQLEIVSLEKEQQVLSSYLSDAAQYRQMFFEFQDKYYKPYSRLPDLWDNAVIEGGWVYNHPNYFNRLVQQLEIKWSRYSQLKTSLEELKQCEMQIAKYEYCVLGDGKYLIGRQKELETILGDIKKEKGIVLKKKENLSNLLRDANRDYLRMENWHQEYQAYLNAIQTGIDSILFELCSEEDVKLQTEMAIIGKKIHDQALILATIETNQKHFKQYTRDIQLIKMLMAALSPQDGLIAKSLVGFIRVFIKQLNSIIANIWSYDLVLDDSDIESIAHDYKFPVNIDNTNRAKDISKTSKGQKEVIDFAFKVLVMHYLKMQKFPLILDEVGHNFSENHRDNFFKYIEELIETNQIQQIFIVSHIASSHDVLTNADIITIEMDNVLLGEHVNKVCKLS